MKFTTLFAICALAIGVYAQDTTDTGVPTDPVTTDAGTDTDTATDTATDSGATFLPPVTTAVSSVTVTSGTTTVSSTTAPATHTSTSSTPTLVTTPSSTVTAPAVGNGASGLRPEGLLAVIAAGAIAAWL